LIFEVVFESGTGSHALGPWTVACEHADQICRSPVAPAAARNIAISLLRLIGCANIARGIELLSRRLDTVLAIIGV